MDSILYPWKYPISLEVKWQISCIPKTPIQASILRVVRFLDFMVVHGM